MIENKNIELILKLKDFDGPLDLLSTLIQNGKMDILHLDIAALTQQYLSFVQQHINSILIENASEYLAMATYLLELKSKKIVLMDENKVDSEFEIERDKLIKRILEYNKYKQTIPKLLSKQELRMSMYVKKPEDISQYVDTNQVIERLPNSIEPNKLLTAMQNAIDKYSLILFSKQKINITELAVDDIEKEIIEIINKNKITTISFDDFITKIDKSKFTFQYFVTCFLALLELVKYRHINLIEKQDKI
jgi:segregation and condensation protein A